MNLCSIKILLRHRGCEAAEGGDALVEARGSWNPAPSPTMEAWGRGKQFESPSEQHLVPLYRSEDQLVPLLSSVLPKFWVPVIHWLLTDTTGLQAGSEGSHKGPDYTLILHHSSLKNEDCWW